MIQVSVIVCSHNPRRDHLEQTLAALEAQSLGADRWELILVDNASQPPLFGSYDLQWHPNVKQVREETLGLTPARLRGISESSAPLLIFVDDDNVLHSNYLEEAMQISRDWPVLAVWGGQVRPGFEEPPPEWTRPYWGMLTREFKENRWSNVPVPSDAVPWGCGLCVRRTVALEYASQAARDPLRVQLDRKGVSLVSGGDIDLALTGIDLGFGVGTFTELELTHLLPAHRMEKTYLLRLAEDVSFSTELLWAIRGRRARNRHGTFLQKLSSSLLFRLRQVYGYVNLPPIVREFYFARMKGKRRAEREWSAHGEAWVNAAGDRPIGRNERILGEPV